MASHACLEPSATPTSALHLVIAQMRFLYMHGVLCTPRQLAPVIQAGPSALLEACRADLRQWTANNVVVQASEALASPDPTVNLTSGGAIKMDPLPTDVTESFASAFLSVFSDLSGERKKAETRVEDSRGRKIVSAREGKCDFQTRASEVAVRVLSR